MLKFITGSKNKFSEIKAMLKPLDLEMINIDLEEIQETDAQKVIEHKVLQGLKEIKDDFIVEDTSLYFECFDYVFPGTFIKWFLGHYKDVGLFNLAKKNGSFKAKLKTIVAYVSKDGKINYFEGINQGNIVSPRGENDFGWGLIFELQNTGKTFGEMQREEKYTLGARGIATRKLKEFLLNEKANT